MSPSFESGIQEEIWRTVQLLNRTWIEGEPEELARFFHKDVVISKPDFSIIGRGREVCIQSYIDFCSHARIRNFRETDPEVFLYGAAAVVTYRFEVEYEMNGKEYHDTGTEFLTLVRDGEGWCVVWRSVIAGGE
jgi:hypothetical protein